MYCIFEHDVYLDISSFAARLCNVRAFGALCLRYTPPSMTPQQQQRQQQRQAAMLTSVAMTPLLL